MNSYPVVFSVSTSPARAISLAGGWAFSLDPKREGLGGKWFSSEVEEVFGDTIQLPGTTDEQKKGPENTARNRNTPTRVHPYVGAAWYRCAVEVPQAWSGKRITLFLERTKTTTVWVDGAQVGDSQESLAAAQVYDLSGVLRPGRRHQLTLCVDNEVMPPIGNPHQISEDTQTNWNGVLGEIALRATDRVWMEDAQLFPNVAAREVRVVFTFGSMGGAPARGHLSLSAKSWNGAAESHEAEPLRVAFEADAQNRYEVVYRLGESARLWSEFSPELYRLEIGYAGESGEMDKRTLDFGLRELRTRGTQFTINGLATMMRGRVDCAIFPLTGYAPMDVGSWLKVLKITRDHGLNHVRFHTWCPPRAAFIAADQLGVYLQPELPFWGTLGHGERLSGTLAAGAVSLETHTLEEERRKQEFLLEEGRRILREYGNHASFTMFCLGNEYHGSREVLRHFVSAFREYDGGRRLLSSGANNFYHRPRFEQGDDYWATCMTGGEYDRDVYEDKHYGYEVRGAQPNHTFGHINNLVGGPGHDYRAAVANVPAPVLGHEFGMSQSYPDFSEIEKYTGVLRARSLERFREQLAERGMLEQAGDFARASGALAALCYREEIEAALRTPGFAGFQMLDLQDFPGQGVALTGMYDTLWNSKGHITPEKWREFCAPVVPLLRYRSYTWTTADKFEAQVEVANYGPCALREVELRWTLSAADRRTLASGRFARSTAGQGGLTALGTVVTSLENCAAPQRLDLSVEVNGKADDGRETRARNSYPLWVYPAQLTLTEPSRVTVTRSYAEAREVLARGGSVFFLPELDSLSREKSLYGSFQNDIWTFPFGKDPTGTLSILCDPKHPALAEFPTEMHTNWQWWRIVKNARPMILDELPHTLRPLVQTIDNPRRNHRIGLVWEACAGDAGGREVRQFLHSLYRYAASQAFAPKARIALEELDGLFSQG